MPWRSGRMGLFSAALGGMSLVAVGEQETCDVSRILDKNYRGMVELGARLQCQDENW